MVRGRHGWIWMSEEMEREDIDRWDVRGEEREREWTYNNEKRNVFSIIII